MRIQTNHESLAVLKKDLTAACENPPPEWEGGFSSFQVVEALYDEIARLRDIPLDWDEVAAVIRRESEGKIKLNSTTLQQYFGRITKQRQQTSRDPVSKGREARKSSPTDLEIPRSSEKQGVKEEQSPRGVINREREKRLPQPDEQDIKFKY